MCQCSMTSALLGLAATAGTPAQVGGGFIELAVLFLILAVVAGVAGAQGIAGLSMDIAKLLVVVFIVLAVASLLL